jgi:hypothetical protein
MTNTSIILQHPSRSHNLATADIETGPKLIKHQGEEPFREDIYEL